MVENAVDGERKGMRRRKSERECVVMCCVCEIGNRVLFLCFV